MGAVTEGKGGTVTLKLVSWMIPVRYLRIWMTESSNTCDTHGASDKRNCLGYAIDELYAGTLPADGQFTDIVKHLASRRRGNGMKRLNANLASAAAIEPPDDPNECERDDLLSSIACRASPPTCRIWSPPVGRHARRSV
jgi:hypothetical protein